MAEQEQNRSEPATPFKLREAKRKGQVAKSLEVISFLVILGLLTVMTFWGERMISGQLRLYIQIWEQAPALNFTIPSLFAWSHDVALNVLVILLPLLGLTVLLAILANLFQTGPVFSFFPIKPDIQRLNPVAGFKRLFSIRLLFESLKTVIKLFIFGFILYFALLHLLPVLLGLMATDPDGYPPILLQALSGIIFKLALAMLLIALLDLAYTRWDYAKRMRMSRREMKEEVRRREGDPQVRARIRELQREAAKRSKALKSVPDADVLITNPTHLAVALEYDRDRMDAPCVTAKGAGELAVRMKAVARKHRVAVVENKGLARKLFAETDLGAPIPESSFPVVARILADVLTREKRDLVMAGRA